MPYRGLEPDGASLLPLIGRIEADARSLAGSLSPAQLNWRPPDGGWSVAQVLTHVTIGNRLYFPVLRRLLADAGPASSRSQAPWRPSFFGRLMIWSLSPTNSRKMPTSSKLKPGPEPGPDALKEFLDTFRELADLTRAAEGHDLNRLTFVSPVSALVRGLNFGDALLLLTVHGQRHLQQIGRVRASPGFPPA